MSAPLAMPWAPAARCYCAPRRLLFTLALGEDVAGIPARSRVRRMRDEPAARTGHGAVDRVLRAFGGAVALARLHAPADGAAGSALAEPAQRLRRPY